MAAVRRLIALERRFKASRFNADNNLVFMLDGSPLSAIGGISQRTHKALRAAGVVVVAALAAAGCGSSVPAQQSIPQSQDTQSQAEKDTRMRQTTKDWCATVRSEGWSYERAIREVERNTLPAGIAPAEEGCAEAYKH
jgi:hypothetical protein